MTKTLNQIFFSSTKIRIFFSATLGIRIFFLEKNHKPPPFKLNGRSLSWLSFSCGLRCLYPCLACPSLWLCVYMRKGISGNVMLQLYLIERGIRNPANMIHRKILKPFKFMFSSQFIMKRMFVCLFDGV